MSGRKHKKNKNIQEYNLWSFLHLTLRDAMNKGVLLPATLSILLILTVLKMPSDDVSKLVFSLLESFKDWSITGWVLAVFLAFGWVFHAKWQRSGFTRELSRIGNEKSKLQERLLGADVKSSKG